VARNDKCSNRLAHNRFQLKVSTFKSCCSDVVPTFFRNEPFDDCVGWSSRKFNRTGRILLAELLTNHIDNVYSSDLNKTPGDEICSYEWFDPIASRHDRLMGLNLISDVSLEGKPIIPGQQLTRKPTWLKSSVLIGHIGFFCLNDAASPAPGKY